MDFRNLVDNVLKKCTATFGEEVTFFPKAGGVYKIQGVFDNDFQMVDVQTDRLISANQPALGVNLNDFNFQIKKDDEVSIRNVRYRIQEKKEDGQGGAVLLLSALRVSDANRDTKANKI